MSASIEQDPVRLISAANWLELQIVFRSRTGAEGSELAEAFLRESRMEVVAHACAILSGHDLLFKGDDFSKTDVPTVRY